MEYYRKIFCMTRFSYLIGICTYAGGCQDMNRPPLGVENG